MSDRVSKELSANAKSLSRSRECFIEVYIDNRCLIIIEYFDSKCHQAPSVISRYLKEQHTLKNVNNCLKTNIYFYLETSGGQSFNLYLNVVHFFNTSVNWTSVAA